MLPYKTHQTVRANFKRARVLVIEDNADHWLFIKRAMQECLSEVTPVWVATADEALKLLNEYSIQEWEIPKLILLDLYLPNRVDGWELLQQIKALPSPCNQIPVIMLSSSSDSTDIAGSYQHGSSSYLVKPLTFDNWITYFQELRTYWWETVTLPPIQFSV